MIKVLTGLTRRTPTSPTLKKKKLKRIIVARKQKSFRLSKPQEKIITLS